MRKLLILILVVLFINFIILIELIYSSKSSIWDFRLKASLDIPVYAYLHFRDVTHDHNSFPPIENTSEYEEKFNIYYGGTLSIELPSLLEIIRKYFYLGIGCNYVLPKSIKNGRGEFSCLPVYGLLNFQLLSKDIIPYISIQLGINNVFLKGEYWKSGYYQYGIKPSGEAYAGIGGGVQFKRFLFEILYTIQQTYFNMQKEVNKVNSFSGRSFYYSKINIGIGYKFTIPSL